MKVDTSESCDAEEPTSGRWGSAVARRVSAVELRFPLASRGFLSIFDQAIYSGTSFVTAVLIGRATSPDQLGLYYVVLSIILVIAGAQEQIVSAPYIVYSKRRQGRELAEYAGSNWAHHFVVTCLAEIGLLLAILTLSISGHTSIVPGLWALIVTAPVLMLRQGIRRFTFASLTLKSAVALDGAVAVLQITGLLLLRHFGLLSLFGIFAVMGGACALGCAGWYLLAEPCVRFVPARFLSDWRHNWGFGKWALRTYLLGFTAPQVMVWIVTAAVGTVATGMFGACNNLIGICNVILGGVDNVLTPQAAHAYAAGGVKELRRILIVAGVFLAVAVGGFCLFVLATGDWLVVLAFGNRYEGTGPILITLALSTGMSALVTLTSNGLWALDQPRATFIADACSMAVMLIAAAALVYPYGALGAALATLAGTTTGAIIRSFTLLRCLEDHDSQPSMVISSAFST